MRNLKYWLVTTAHLEDLLLFRDAEDFRVAMSYVAVQAFKTGVFVLAFILMSNHLHFVLAGSREQVEAFVNGFKAMYSRYYWDKYGVQELLRRNQVDFSEIDTVDDALERAIAYVQMNCVAANICSWPSDYPWGTGACFFTRPEAGMVDTGGARRGQPLAALSARERYRLLHTKAELPGEWMLYEGYISPASYVPVKWVEKLFQTPKRMNFFLRNSSKAKVLLEAGEKRLPSFRDQVIVSALPDLCRSLFRKGTLAELEEEQLVELMRQLRFRFAANVNQIARVTGVSYERAAMLLDRA
jgi:REP element-mobilizing transposase RayT